MRYLGSIESIVLSFIFPSPPSLRILMKQFLPFMEIKPGQIKIEPNKKPIKPVEDL